MHGEGGFVFLCLIKEENLPCMQTIRPWFNFPIPGNALKHRIVVFLNACVVN